MKKLIKIINKFTSTNTANKTMFQTNITYFISNFKFNTSNSNNNTFKKLNNLSELDKLLDSKKDSKLSNKKSHLKVIFNYNNHINKSKRVFRFNMGYLYIYSFLLLAEISNPISYSSSHSLMISISIGLGYCFFSFIGSIISRTVSSIEKDSKSGEYTFHFMTYHYKTNKMIVKLSDIYDIKKSNIEGFYYFRLAQTGVKYYINLGKNTVNEEKRYLYFLFNLEQEYEQDLINQDYKNI
jgi:hypothetical protein